MTLFDWMDKHWVVSGIAVLMLMGATVNLLGAIQDRIGKRR